MTEQTPSDDSEHAARFAQGSKNLMALFDAMLISAPDLLSPQDVALIIYGASLKALLAANGIAGGLEIMRAMIVGIERTGQPPTLN